MLSAVNTGYCELTHKPATKLAQSLSPNPAGNINCSSFSGTTCPLLLPRRLALWLNLWGSHPRIQGQVECNAPRLH
jgi:hypothetical protein